MAKPNNAANLPIILFIIGFFIISSFPILIPFIVFGFIFYFTKSNISIDKIIANTGIIEKLADKKIINGNLLNELKNKDGNIKFLQLLEELKKGDTNRKDRIMQKRRDLADKLNENNSSLRIKDETLDINMPTLNYGDDISYTEETKTYINGKETDNIDFPSWSKDEKVSVFVDEDIIIPENKTYSEDKKVLSYKTKKKKEVVKSSNKFATSAGSIWDNYDSVMDDFKK